MSNSTKTIMEMMSAPNNRPRELAAGEIQSTSNSELAKNSSLEDIIKNCLLPEKGRDLTPFSS